MTFVYIENSMIKCFVIESRILFHSNICNMALALAPGSGYWSSVLILFYVLYVCAQVHTFLL